jgi:methylated-DNA-[protein]-cysteine S-methyltransferase
MAKYFSMVIGSPVGPLKLVASGAGLAAILWKDDSPRRVRLDNVVEDATNSILLETQQQLGEYFCGRRKAFTVKLDFAGTEFQRRVWSALLTIPYGETRSYAEVARQIGSPAAVRAVGAANGRNPLSIIAPCHRVVGSNGKLTGFAGGLHTKAQLLALEREGSGKLDGCQPPQSVPSSLQRVTSSSRHLLMHERCPRICSAG